MAVDWEQFRSLFRLDPEWVHLSGMLLASHPEPVRLAIAEHRKRLDANPARYVLENKRRFEGEVRASAALYLGVDAGEIALTDNTTKGLMLLYAGLRLEQAEEVVLLGYNHWVVEDMLAYRAQHGPCRFRSVPLWANHRRLTDREMLDQLRAAVTAQTRAVAVTWVHSDTGIKIPLPVLAEELERINRRRDESERVLLCVDGVHGLGVEDITLPELGCDVFVAGTHKWIFGPRGTGIMWAKKAAWKRIVPTIPTFSDRSLPAGPVTPGGYHPFEHRWALRDAFELHQRIGKAEISGRSHELAAYLKDRLRATPGVTLHTPLSPDLSAAIVVFDIDGMKSTEVVEHLLSRHIETSVTSYKISPEGTHARFSPAAFNSFADIDRAMDALPSP